MSKQTIFPTVHGCVVVKFDVYSWLMDAFVIDFTITPPDLHGWGISQSIPVDNVDIDSDSGEISFSFIHEWADNAIGKLRV